MTAYGPWITPPPVSDSAPMPYEATVFRRWTIESTTASFADVCEGLGPTFQSQEMWLSERSPVPGDTGIAGQVKLATSLDDIVGFLADASPTLPPGASGVDYDPADPPSLAWLTGNVTTTIGLTREDTNWNPVDNIDWPITARLIDPATFTAADPWPPSVSQPPAPPVMPQPPDQVDGFTPGATLTTLPSAAHWSIPTITNPPTSPGSPVSFTRDVTLPLTAYADVAGRRWAVLILHFDAQVTHTAPDSFTFINVRLDNTITSITLESYDEVLVGVAYTYQPRRYRFVFPTLPPLRQFPRDDAIGGSPRQGKTNGPTSVQGSARQGWRGTYR